MGPEPAKTIHELIATAGSSLAILLYDFDRRSELNSLASDNVKLAKRPISASMLRGSTMSLVIGSILKPEDGSDSSLTSAEAAALTAGNSITPRFYSEAELGRLQEISSAVQCECPNHLAGLLTGLFAFEDYSKDCENKRVEDANIHRMLYEATARARAVIEVAMQKLCKHEGIEL